MAALPPAPRSRGRRAFVAVVAVLGACEAFSCLPDAVVALVPAWLGGPISLVGFLVFLVLAGPLGNPVAALSLLLVAWRDWRWPLWRAALWTAPLWVMSWRLMPKPW